MSKNLLIVESPSKAKTIQSYLGKDYKVIATVGHIIDLPTSKLGVDVDNKYEIDYTVIKGKDKVIKELKKSIKETEGTVYLSPDPDREGESIAWQVTQIANDKKKDFKRVVFHEVTKSAIKEALENPRTIDENLVEAQQGRRVLDRLVGYPLSQLLWKKIQYGLSAGRVQSVALRLICEREKEIRDFVAEKYNTFEINYKELGNLTFKLSDKKGELLKLKPEEAVKAAELLEGTKKHLITSIKEKDVTQSPSAPFTTSSLQQEANRKLGFTAKLTMKVAQELYQGINLGKDGLQGLITYMRTDSTNLSEQAVHEIRGHIESEYGKEYLNESVRKYKTKAKVAQEAHEAIRPTHVSYTPKSVAEYLTPQQRKLYTLIWNRAVGTQMKQALFKEKTVTTLPTEKDSAEYLQRNDWRFQYQFSSLVFDGYLKLVSKEYPEEDKALREIAEKQVLTVERFTNLEQFTAPKGRYNDASLVKELEKKGIGRPSTYASIISTLITRNYVVRENKLLTPTDVGMLVSDFLVKNFPNIVDYNFTAKMEDQLDGIVNQKVTKVKMLNDFYPDFIKDIQSKEKTIKKEELTNLGVADKKCLKCGSEMVIKVGPYGKYIQCTNQECKYSEPYVEMDKYYIPEDVAKEGYVLKRSKFGMFWAHPQYPEVKKTLPLLLKDVCPECGHHLVERKSKTGRPFVGCSNYPKCKYIVNNRKFNATVKAKRKK
jgi:DNA topoisomerase-1